MKLYSIRHKHSGLFFVCTYAQGQLNWAPSPTFWKTIDGIKRNLERIGSDYSPRPILGGRFHVKSFDNFDPKRLENIEVIITDVSILGEQTLPAADIFDVANSSPSTVTGGAL